jgi:hypothetical protein
MAADAGSEATAGGEAAIVHGGVGEIDEDDGRAATAS